MPSKVDTNQKDIVAALRAVGVSILHLHTLGEGAPDILCGFSDINILMEIKDGDKSSSARKLTPDQKKWHNEWKGQVVIVNSVYEALAVISKIRCVANEEKISNWKEKVASLSTR